jgi:hypothetical protein
MFGLVCRGLHCAGCKGGGGFVVLIGGLILCLISLPSIEAILAHAIIVGALIIGSAIFLSGVAYAIISRWCEKRMLYARGSGFLTIQREAWNADNRSRETAITRSQYPQIPGHHVNAILPRHAYEWQEEGQFDVPKRGDKR